MTGPGPVAPPPAGPPPPAAVELVRVRLPLLVPLRSAHGTESVRDLVLVRALGADGAEGWGECSALARPTYSPEHTAGAWDVLGRRLAPAALAGRAAADPDHPMASAGLATALADLALRRAGRSLADHLGATRARVPSCAVVGRAASVADVVAAVGAAVARGHAQVKLKVEPGWCAEPLAAVRDRFPALALAADGNGSLGGCPPGELAALDHLALSYLEQPLPPGELAATAALARRLATPVALDESLTSVAAAAAALAAGALGVANVKPARLGGPAPAAELARWAAAHGVAAFVGGMLETGVGRAAALAVAALEACALPTDLGPSDRYFAADLTAPLELRHGRLEVPAGPGIGVAPDPGRLAAAAVDRLLVRR